MTLNTPDCLFCKIVTGQMPANIVWSGPEVTAFTDIQPQAPIHYLLIPNHHVPDIAGTRDDRIFSLLVSAARDLAQAQGLTDYRLVFNNGPQAGQSVFHLHLHLLAGRKFDWPPG